MKIVFYRGTGIINRAIRFFSRGGYSHVAIILKDGSIIEAYPFKGVRRRSGIKDEIKKDTTIETYMVPASHEECISIEQFLISQLGKKYDYLSVFGFILYATKESRKASQKWFCSELVFAAFQKANINLLERVDAWKVSPSLLSYSPYINFVDRFIVEV